MNQIGGHVRQHVVLRFEIFEIQPRNLMRVGVFRVVAGDNNEAVWIPNRQGRKQEGIDDAEHGGVRADAGGKSKHRDGCEAGALREHAESVADVLPQIFHRCTSEMTEIRTGEIFCSGTG